MSVEMNEVLLKALEYASRGWCVIPLFPLDAQLQCTCNSKDCPGKHPFLRDWISLATRQETTITGLWKDHPNRGVGIITGKRSDIVVVDVDPRNGGNEGLAVLIKQHGPLPETYTVETGGGGLHYYFEYPKDTNGVLSCKLGVGIDFKANARSMNGGHFVVAPPTLHPSGERYRVKHNCQLAKLPDWILATCTQIQLDATSKGIPETIPIGETHETLKRVLGRFRHAGLLKQEALDKSRELNRTHCERELPDQELMELVDAVYSYNRTNYTCDDIGNLNRFTNDHKNTLRYVNDASIWLVWLINHWQPQFHEHFITKKCIESIEQMKGDADLIPDPAVRDAVEAWARRCRFEPRIAALHKLCPSAFELWTATQELDQDPLLLNCLNGIVDLSTGRLSPHDRSKMCTKIVNVPYIPSAKSEMWERFLEEADEHDKAQKNYMQLAAGYSCTGFTDEEVLFFIHGPGGTGKTTFVESIRCVLGEYAKVVRPQVFLDDTTASGNASPAIAKLLGARFVASSEMPRGQRLSGWAIKALSGGDTVTARHLFKEEFEFQPKFKIWLTMNELPTFHHKDTGMKRRIIPIPFTFVPKQPNAEMKRAFKLDLKEQQAILAWMVEGARRWIKGEHLSANTPSRIIESRKDYFSNVNPIEMWLKSAFTDVPYGEKRTLKSASLFSALKSWCELMHISLTDIGVSNDRQLGDMLKELGYNKDTQNLWNLKPISDNQPQPLTQEVFK